MGRPQTNVQALNLLFVNRRPEATRQRIDAVVALGKDKGMNMRIDAHQHFMVYNAEEYVWVTDELSELKGTFLPADSVRLLESINFDGCIAVQARNMVKEIEWLLGLAQTSPVIKGVVGWVDLTSPDVATQLERYAGYPKMRGVRHALTDEPDDMFMLRDDFRRGIGKLRQFDLTYDLLIFPKHIPYAIELVQEHPDQKFVLDHIGNPNIRDGVMSPWDLGIAELGRFDNVFCKLSGMAFVAEWHKWKPEDFAPYLDVVFNAFGPERLIVGSNWPVCTVSGDYESVMGIVLTYLSRFSSETREKILGENCRRFYGVVDDSG